LEKRRNELENERTRLSKMMDADRKKIMAKIKVKLYVLILYRNLNKELDEFKELGMYYKDKKELAKVNLNAK
jgi:hypothetical protein